MPYHLAILPTALRQIARLPQPDQKRVRQKIDGLALDPYPVGVKKLQGKRRYLRVRSGNYRIIYTTDDDRLIVVVITVGHRREVYRSL